jgi:P-type Cu+ transporter
MESNCHIETIQKTVSEVERAVEETVVLAVWGMGCPTCAIRVRNSLISLHGVTEAYVDHSIGSAKIFYNPHLVNIESLLDAVRRSGGDGRHEYGASPV